MLFVWGKFLPPCVLYGHHAFCMGDVSSAMLFVWENCSHACFSYGRRVFRHVFTMGEVSSTMLFVWETCSPLCFLYGKIGLLHGAHLAKCKHKPGSNWPRAPVGLMLGVCYGTNPKKVLQLSREKAPGWIEAHIASHPRRPQADPWHWGFVVAPYSVCPWQQRLRLQP